MATAIGLSMQLSASTSGLTSGLTEAEKLINKLGRGAESAAKYFDTFRDAATGELPAAMQEIVDQAGQLTTQFRDGQISSDAFAAGIQAISSEAGNLTKAFQEGVSITAQYRTEEEKRASQIERLGQLLAQGAINQETYDRAMSDASGASAEAAAAERELAAAKQQAESITRSVMTAEEKYAEEIASLQKHLDEGRISQETFDRAAAKAKSTMEAASGATKKAGDSAEKAGLQFNELSGLVSLLPGPIGAIAGRLSGFASAGGALEKVFAGGGGLQGALGALQGSVTALINPFSLAVAGIAGFGAAAAAVTKGLLDLSDRVERLGQQADKIGASFEFIQVIEEAAARAGSSVETVGASFRKFLPLLDDAKKGSEKAVAAFAAIGISAEELKSLSPEEAYKRVAAAIVDIEDPAARAAAATDLLGKSALELIPTFKGLSDSKADLERYFAILTDVDKIRLEGFDSSVEKLGTATKGLGQSLLLPFVGLGDGIAKGSAEFVGGITAFVKPIGQVLEPFLTQAGRTIELFLNGLGSIGRTIGAVLEPFGRVFSAVSAAIAPALDAFYDFSQAIQGIDEQVVAFLMKFTSIGVIADNIDLIVESIKPFVTAFVDGLNSAVEVVQRLGVIVATAFEQVASVIASTIGRAVEVVGSSISTFLEFTGVGQVVASAFDVISKAFGSLWANITGIISGIGGFIEKVLQFAENWLGITREIETPVQAEIQLDTTEPALAATQFYAEITKAVEATKGLGAEGFDAALKYQQTLEDLAQLAAEGALSEDELKRAAANATTEFEKSIAPLQAAEKEREKAAKAAEDAAKKQIDADRKVADQLIETQRIDAEFGGNKERAKAAEDLLAINREIERVQAEQAAAAAANDKSAESAAAARLAALDQAKAAVAETAEFGFNQADVDTAIKKVQEDIAKGISQAEVDLDPEAADKFFDTIKELEDKLDLKIIDPKQFEEATKAARKTFDDAAKQAKKVRDLEIKYDEEAAKIQEERIAELGRVSQESLQANDVRTSEGASTFLRLATGREDPAIEEYRKQLKKLDEIKKEIAKAQAEPVEIL
jgi:phage-related protein